MKWIAIFTVLIADGAPIEVVDEDGPREFATQWECLHHVKIAIPKMERILISYTANLDILLIEECRATKLK